MARAVRMVLDGAGLAWAPGRRNQAAASAVSTASRKVKRGHRYRCGGEETGATGCGWPFSGAASGDLWDNLLDDLGVFGNADMSGACFSIVYQIKRLRYAGMAV